MKNILVTGGFGHIGAQLVRVLAPNNRVIVLDNSLFGRSALGLSDIDIEIYVDDVRNLNDYSLQCDLVFHFGEYSRVEQSLKESAKVFENNIGGIIPVLSFCKRTGAKLIYAGSSTKFADDGLASKTNPYAISKRINTEVVKEYCTYCDLDYAIVYFNNVYGPGEMGIGTYATVIEKFLCLREEDEALPVTLPGTQRRAFTHIDDTVAALVVIAERGFGDGYIICADEDYSIIDIARYISNDVELVEGSVANRMSGVLDNSKVRELDWAPKVDLFKYLDARLSEMS